MIIKILLYASGYSTEPIPGHMYVDIVLAAGWSSLAIYASIHKVYGQFGCACFAFFAAFRIWMATR